MSIERWNNVPGKFIVELYLHEGQVYDAHTDTLLPDCLVPFVDNQDDSFVLVIEFNSSGYDDPGSMYGGPHNLGWAPERSDERLLDRAYIDRHEIDTDGDKVVVLPAKKVELPKETQDKLFEYFLEQIQQTELEDHE